MKSVCSWCEKVMICSDPQDAVSEEFITHGICDDCLNQVLWPHRPELGEFLDNLEAPVLVVNSLGDVSTANKYARELLHKELSEIEGLPGGIVFECAFAKLPLGCGKTLHCDGCTIRNTVMDTFQTGVSHLKTPAGLTRGTSDEHQEIQFLISTEKVNDLVLLRIDNAL